MIGQIALSGLDELIWADKSKKHGVISKKYDVEMEHTNVHFTFINVLIIESGQSAIVIVASMQASSIIIFSNLRKCIYVSSITSIVFI